MKRVACALLLLCACDARVTTLGRYRTDADAAGAEVDADAPERGQYFEAEAGELSGDYRVQSETRASAGSFLAAPENTSADAAPGNSRARYEFRVERDATYLIWVRMHGPDAEHNRFWYQVDQDPFRKMRLSTGDVWYWNPLHDDASYDRPLEFSLSAGPHSLLIANCVAGTDVDRFYVTAAGDQPPGNDTPCLPPHSIERAGICIQSCGVHGKTDCGGPACQGKPVVDAYDCALCCLLD